MLKMWTLPDVHIQYKSWTRNTLLHPCPDPVRIIF